MRALMAFIILITAGYTVFFAWWLSDGSGPADDKVRTFLSYSLSFTSAFLALLTIFVSVAGITRDIKSKEIFTVTTKPVSRGGYLFGKFLGISLVNLMLLVISAGIIYGLARYLERTQPVTANERERLSELVLTSRRSVRPTLPDTSSAVSKKVEETVARELRDNPARYKNNPVLVDKMRRSLHAEFTNQVTMAQRAIQPGGHIVWHFTGISPVDREDGYVYIRYKQDVSANPVGYQVINEWGFGPRDPLLHGGRMMPPKKEVIRTVHEFPIPVSAVSEEGDLYVYYRNPTDNRYVSVIFPPDEGIEALYVAGSFEGNFLRAITLIYLQLLFLGILGIAIGGWLGFPVAVLVVLTVYVIGQASGFIASAMKWEAGENLRNLTNIVVAVFPRFSTYDPVPQIEKGRLVSYQMLMNCSVFMVLIKGGIIAFIGYLIFKFRELARVII